MWVLLLLKFWSVSGKLFEGAGELVLRANEVVKLRCTMGRTAARRAAANAERWRNMADSIELCLNV